MCWSEVVRTVGGGGQRLRWRVDGKPLLTRRRVLTGLGIGAACMAVDAFGVEPHWLQVDHHAVAIANLPHALEGLRIVQITDAHLNGLGRVEAAILAAIDRAAPQLVVLTGDIVDHVDRFEDLAELCSAITQRGARVLGTLGNWEHWGRVPLADLARVYARSGATLMIDEWLEHEGLAIYASDDSTGGSPRSISAGSSRSIEVLLTHSPAFVDEQIVRPFALCLAGHTHGGQIRAGSVVPYLPPGSGRFVEGWYETAIGPLYVSRGTGTSGLPARFCCRPELPVFELVRA
jgi:predicted MPP superfamily phosphohydrolase